MKTWTKQAEERLEEYLDARISREGAEGEEASELRGDLKAHLHEDAAQSSAERIGLAELEQMLAKLDGRQPEKWVPREEATKGRKWVMFFGVILPALVIMFEIITNFCGGPFFDPVPTVWHALLLFSVPILNFWLLGKGRSAGSLEQGIAAGVMLGVSGFYALLFLPLLPLSVPAVIFFGLGILSLSPILAFWAGWCIFCRNRGKVTKPWLFRKGWRIGVASAVLLLLALEAPAMWTRVQLDRALSSEENTEISGIKWLRKFHSEKTLLKTCYEGNGRMSFATDISGWMMTGWKVPFSLFGSADWSENNPEKTRSVFFRATGKAFNSLKPPRLSRGNMLGGNRGTNADEFEFDEGLGGDSVAMRLKYLDLVESRFDGHVDSASRLGYGEWTMVFQNTSAQAKEARCQVRLPRDGRVSRLTLWVNGEPREAAFNSVSKVKAAYKEVAVVQRRDPVLVTMSGPDTILVQCFPVPANGKMKIRFGITAPLDGDQWELPRVVERNFGVKEKAEHFLWMQADSIFGFLGKNNMRGAVKDGDGFSANSTLRISQILEKPLALRFASLPSAGTVWCEDKFAADGEKFLERRLENVKRAGVEKLVVVIDGSASMADSAEFLGEIFTTHSSGTIELIIADDGVKKIYVEEIESFSYSGGRDNEPALHEAISIAKSVESSAIIWLHGPQAVELSNPEGLLQLLERGMNRPQIYDVEMVGGANLLAGVLGKEGMMKRGPSIFEGEELGIFIKNLISGGEETKAIWRRAAGKEQMEGAEVWDHLARAWAMEKSESNDAEKAQIAAKYQLVTPVSGAVVLETIEQFRRNGLEPVDPNSVPSVPGLPEPSTALLLLLGAMSALLRRKR